jgi:hypothetical protein
VRQLQTAITTALQATRKIHPEAQIAPAVTSDSEAFIYRPWWICGVPLPWPLGPGYDYNKAVEFATTFASNLEKNPTVAPLAIDGKIAPAVYFSGSSISVGFVPGEASLTQ